MSTNKQVIPVFFATDDNYVPLLSVALTSLVENSTNTHTYNIHILTDGLTNENCEILKSVEKENINIYIDNIKEKIANVSGKLHTRDYYSKSTYYRFFIAKLYPEYDKVLYLDCDIIILKDIADLYNIELGNNLVGAASEEVMTGEKVFGDYVEKALKIDRYKYFNAGILIINLKLFREEEIEEKFYRILSKYTFRVTQDEDYLNVLTYGRVKLIDLTWNKMPVKVEGIEDEDLKLIHYKLFYRPWQTDGILYGEKFWKYAKLSKSYNKILEMKNNFTEEKRQKGLLGYENLKKLALSDIEYFKDIDVFDF